jgi:DNA-binding MarR family transcriptional regulator
MAHISSHEIRISEFAKLSGLSGQAVHKHVKELSHMGLVTMHKYSTNESTKSVSLAKKGNESVRVTTVNAK